MTQNTHDPQNDADAPTERSHAANLLNDYCFQQGIPTNPILPSDNPPRHRVASVLDPVPGVWPARNYLGELIPPSMMRF